MSVLRRSHRLSAPITLLALALAGCEAGAGTGIFTTGGAGGGSVSTVVTTGDGATNTVGSTAAQFMSGGTTGGGTTCISGADEDKDQDGFSVNEGDCNDCDANVNPGAIEVIITEPDPMTGMVPPPADEDCDGEIDNVAMPCDGGIAVDENDPTTVLRAVELCKQVDPAKPKSWGVVSAKWVYPDGATPSAVTFDIGHGVLNKFGSNVTTRAGTSMLALSSGGCPQTSRLMAT